MVIVQLIAQKYYEYSTPAYIHAVHAWSKIAISILYSYISQSRKDTSMDCVTDR